jgi:hypothetical protein
MPFEIVQNDIVNMHVDAIVVIVYKYGHEKLNTL